MSQPPPILVAKRYELREVVGKGGYGVVYRGWDREQQRQVALKVLSAGSGNDPHVVERMVREQQAMLALAGTCAVSAIDLCKTRSGSLCLVMEWLEGMDLEQHLTALESEGKHMEVARLLSMLRPIVDTLGRAHDIGIVHRDIKPANIFLLSDPNQGVRLLDFGLSRMRTAATLTAAGMVMGSPSYIAPETWRGNSKLVDHRADLYSLTVIVFRALSGRVPFEGNLVEKFTLTTSAERPSLHALRPDLPRGVDEWVEQGLAIEPTLRFFAAHAWFNALVTVLSEPLTPLLAPIPGVDKDSEERRSALTDAWHAASSLLKRFTRRKTLNTGPVSVSKPAHETPSEDTITQRDVLKWLATDDAEGLGPESGKSRPRTTKPGH